MVGTSNTRTSADEVDAVMNRLPHKRRRWANKQVVRHAFVEMAGDDGPEIDQDHEENFPERADGPDHMSQIM